MKKLLPFLAIAVCVFAMVAASAPKSGAQLGTASIAGVITDSVTGLPIGGAKVTAGMCGRMATTASDGTYLIANLAAGDYTVKAMKMGAYAMKQYPTPVHVDDGQAVTGINIALAPMGGGGGGTGSISGTVYDKATNQPIEGVKVMAGMCGGGYAMTASDGTYTISNLADGSYTVKAMKTGYTCTAYPTPVVVANGQPVSGIDFHLVPNSTRALY